LQALTQRVNVLEARQFRFTQWRMLLATMFCYLFYYTGRQTFGFAIPGIHEELGISLSNLGWASAILLWSYAVGQAINGNLADRFGGRRMMSLGAVLSCGLNWLVSFGNSLGGLLVPWAANGYAQSMGWAPGSRVLSNWWNSKQRGFVFGMYVFAAGMASVLTYVTSLLIIEFDLGWRSIFRFPVLLMLLGGSVFFLLARDRPEDLGFSLEDDDDSNDQSNRAINAPLDIDENADSSYGRYLYVLGNVRFMIASCAIGFQNLARYGLLVWVPVHFLGSDWKDSDSKWIAVALPVGMALGALTSGWISDRLFGSNRSRIIFLFLMLASVSSLGMFLLPPDHPAGIIVLFCCGFFAYGPQSAFWALCPDLLGKERAGTGTGVMNCVAYTFAGFGEPFIGAMIEYYDNTGAVFVIVSVACCLGAVISLFIKR
jgi:OPA family glycerol-3-phosphate transporter-like MFS transporter